MSRIKTQFDEIIFQNFIGNSFQCMLCFSCRQQQGDDPTMKYKPQAKSGLALLAGQSCVLRCWSFNGQLSAQTHHGTFTFKSLDDVRAWIAKLNA